jgi:hypothetical protein
MSELQKRTINDYTSEQILTGNENLLIDMGDTYKKTTIKNVSSFNDQIILKNGGLTSEDINKFVVCYTDNTALTNFINDGGDFDDFDGILNEARLPELESFEGQSGLYRIEINTEYLNLYNQNDQILFASIDSYGNEESIYDSFDLRLRSFNFRLDDPYFTDLINTEGFEYELLDTDRYIPSNSTSYTLMLNYYFLNGIPNGSYDGSSNLTSFVGEEFVSLIEFSIVDGFFEIEVPITVDYYYFQGNDRYLSDEDRYVKFIDDITIKRLIRSLGPKLRRKIFGILSEINDDGTVKILSLPNSYEAIPFNSFGSDDYIVNLIINTNDEDDEWWGSSYIPFVGGLLYNVDYVCDEFNYYSNDSLLLSTTQRYTPITTNKITNPILFVKEDYGDD